MLQPKKTKYRKLQRMRGSLKGNATRGTEISFGTYALKATTRGYLNSREIEAARRAIARSVKRGGEIWIRIFPDKPVTKKASEVPMGGGKGGVEYYVAPIKPGRILFEMAGVTPEVAKEALSLASYKLSVKTKIVTL